MLNLTRATAQRLRLTVPTLLLLSALASCGQQQAPPSMPPIEVGALEVKPQALALTLEHAAQLRGVREVEVRLRQLDHGRVSPRDRGVRSAEPLWRDAAGLSRFVVWRLTNAPYSFAARSEFEAGSSVESDVDEVRPLHQRRTKREHSCPP